MADKTDKTDKETESHVSHMLFFKSVVLVVTYRVNSWMDGL